MDKQASRARIVALGVLLIFTVTVYVFWQTSEDMLDRTSVEHVKIVKPIR